MSNGFVQYPAVVNTPHYQVAVSMDDGSPDLLSGMLHPDRAGAEREWARWRSRQRSSPMFDRFEPVIWAFKPVFLLRCGHCADIPGDTLAVYTEWWDLQWAIADHWGWLATSEQDVFCPRHRPSGEY